MTAQRGWIFAVLAVAAILLLGRVVSTLVVDHAWYTAMGAAPLFWERLTDTALLQGLAWLAGSLFAFANLDGVRQTISSVVVPTRVGNIELTSMIPSRRLLSITVGLAALIGIALAIPLTDWTTVALARHGIAFGEIEGYLGRDLGFYLYWLPLEETLYIWALVTVVSMTAVVLVLYALTRSLRIEGRRFVVSTHVRRHLSVLAATVLLLLAWSYRLDAFDVLRDGSGPDGLFARVDHVVTLRVDSILSILCGVAALLILRAGWYGQLRMALTTLSIVLASALGLRHALPTLLSRGTLLGDPAKRDRDYIATRTLVSRRAYDVDGIQFAGADTSSTRMPLVATSEVARSVSVWDAAAVRARLTDASRTSRADAPIGWIAEDGAIRALLVRRAAAGPVGWTARIAFTGEPTLRDSVIDIPKRLLASGEETVDGPVVAPGERGYRLVHDTSGSVLGTPLTAIRTRLAHAWAQRDPALLDADSVGGGDGALRFVDHRDVRERVQLLAPVFALGDEVRPLLYDGTLYWTVDLYSATDSYPLSQRWMLAGGVRSYFRHAATAVVDASSGAVHLVGVRHPDPVARTWMATMPSLFVGADDLPAGLARALPPPTDGAIAQLRTLAEYGSRAEGPGRRTVADSALVGEGPTPHLVHVDSTIVLAWSAALLDAGNVASGVFTAAGGARRSSYFQATTAPRSRWPVMLEQVRAALDTAKTALPDVPRRDIRTRPGHVQTLFTDRGPLLVEPLQFNRGDGNLVISRVALWIGGRVGVGMKLADALAGAQGGSAPLTALGRDDPAFSEARDVGASRLYDVMRDAMRRGDWTRFGAAFDSLGQMLGKPPQ